MVAALIAAAPSIAEASSDLSSDATSESRPNSPELMEKSDEDEATGLDGEHRGQIEKQEEASCSSATPTTQRRINSPELLKKMEENEEAPEEAPGLEEHDQAQMDLVLTKSSPSPALVRNTASRNEVAEMKVQAKVSSPTAPISDTAPSGPTSPERMEESNGGGEVTVTKEEGQMEVHAEVPTTCTILNDTTPGTPNLTELTENNNRSNPIGLEDEGQGQIDVYPEASSPSAILSDTAQRSSISPELPRKSDNNKGATGFKDETPKEFEVETSSESSAGANATELEAEDQDQEEVQTANLPEPQGSTDVSDADETNHQSKSTLLVNDCSATTEGPGREAIRELMDDILANVTSKLHEGQRNPDSHHDSSESTEQKTEPTTPSPVTKVISVILCKKFKIC